MCGLSLHRTGSYAKRTFSSRFAPSSCLHYHPYQHTNRLTKTSVTIVVRLRQKLFDYRLSLKFTDNTSQRRTIVMNFSIFHSNLTFAIVKESNYKIKWLFWIGCNVTKVLPVRVIQKFFYGRFDSWHGLNTEWSDSYIFRTCKLCY